MRFVRYGEKGLEKPGLLDAEGHIRDLADIQAELGGVEFGDNTLMYLNVADPEKLPRVPGKPRLGPCIANVGKVVGVAINYRMHADETCMKQPSEPVLFLTATSAICGPYDDLVLPRGSQKTDWEVELGVVIGRRA